MPWLKENWGSARQSPEEKLREVARYKALLAEADSSEVDPGRGRVVFQKTCAACHFLHGEGGKVGPDLTHTGRHNLDSLLQKVIDPNAIVPRDYQAWLLTTKDGRVLTGIIRMRTDAQITLATGKEEVTVSAQDIDTLEATGKTLMPEGTLNNLKREEVLDLFTYLQSRTQPALLDGPARPEPRR